MRENENEKEKDWKKRTQFQECCWLSFYFISIWTSSINYNQYRREAHIFSSIQLYGIIHKPSSMMSKKPKNLLSFLLWANALDDQR